MSFTWECIYWWIDWLINWLIDWLIDWIMELICGTKWTTAARTCFQDLQLYIVHSMIQWWFNSHIFFCFLFFFVFFCFLFFFGFFFSLFFCLCFFFESYKRIIKNGRGTTWFTLPIFGIFFKFPDHRIRRKRYRGSWQGSSLPTLSLSTAQLHRRFHWICFQRNWTHQKLPKSTSRN